ncbi:MAG: hypothetical protein ACRD0X_07475 [Thermoanaerobaculia bacterium]
MSPATGRTWALPLWALVALPTGCRTEARSAAAPVAELRACDLLTLEEADPGGREGLQPMRTPLDTAAGADAAKCSYAAAELPSRVVALEVRRYPTVSRAAAAQRGAASFLPSLSGVGNAPVHGLGDEAIWAGGRLGQLHLRSEALRLIVTVEVGEEGARGERARALAARGLERLAPSRVP